MKKTLIALALFASCGSAVADSWVQNGIGGNVELGGTLTPAEVVTPWEVMVGAGNTSLDQTIRTGATSAVITTSQSIPVLGIRTRTEQPFQGQKGISPHIDYNGAVDMSKNVWGAAPVFLDIYDDVLNKIGSLETTILTAAVYSYLFGSESTYGGLAATDSDSAFWGGLGTFDSALGYDDAVSVLNKISDTFLENFNKQNASTLIGKSLTFDGTGATYSAAYGSGINAGTEIRINLNSPVTKTTVWKAPLSVTVSYQ